jgi:hypothetical protein
MKATVKDIKEDEQVQPPMTDHIHRYAHSCSVQSCPELSSCPELFRCPKLSRAVQNCSIVQSCPELSRAVQLSKFVQSCPELSRVVQLPIVVSCSVAQSFSVSQSC